MPDDEPLDDARQVATAAATAAARLIETAAREAQDAAAQHRATLERSQDQQRARDSLSGLGQRFTSPEQEQQRGRDEDRQRVREQQRRTELDQAQAWASPERLHQHWSDREGSDSIAGRADADRALVREWKAATAPYDSQDRRQAADGVREGAGVSADARQVRATADLMNGTDPATATAESQGRGSTNSSSQHDQGRQARLTEQAPPKVQRVQQGTPTR